MSFDFEPVNASSSKQRFVNDAKDDRSYIDENEDEEYEVEAIVDWKLSHKGGNLIRLYKVIFPLIFTFLFFFSRIYRMFF